MSERPEPDLDRVRETLRDLEEESDESRERDADDAPRKELPADDDAAD